MLTIFKYFIFASLTQLFKIMRYNLFLLFFITLSFSQNYNFNSLTNFLSEVQKNNLNLLSQKKQVAITTSNRSLTIINQTAPTYSAFVNKQTTAIPSRSSSTTFNHRFQWKPFFSTNTELAVGINSIFNPDFSEVIGSGASNAFDNTTSFNRWTSRYFLEVRQPLLRSGLNGEQKVILKQQNQQINLAQANYKKELENTLALALNLFVQYQQQQKIIAALNEFVKNYQKVEDFQNKQYQRGLIDQTTLYQSQIATLSNQHTLEQEKLHLQSLQINILELLNKKKSRALLTLTFKPQQILLYHTLDSKILYQKALYSNTDLLIAKINLNINQSALKLTQKSLLPKLDVNAQLFKGDRRDNFLSSYQAGLAGRFEYTIGGVFEIPLYGYSGKTRKDKQQIQKSKLSIQQNSSHLRNSLQNLTQEIKRLEKAMKMRQKIYNLTSKRHQLIEKKYLAGEINYADYILSQNSLQTSLNDLNRSSLNYQLQIIELQKISGTLLTHYNITL